MENNIDFDAIARATSGASGAELANIVNEAALRAVRMGRTKVNQNDLMESVEVILAGYQRKGAVISPEEKQIKDAVMDTLKARIAYANDGMRSTVKASEHSHKVMAQHKIKIEGNTVTQNGEPIFAIHRRYSAKKTQGCYRELTPTLEYIRQEKAQEAKQEKPSIREQLKAAAKAQSERKAPARAKKHDMGLE